MNKQKGAIRVDVHRKIASRPEVTSEFTVQPRWSFRCELPLPCNVFVSASGPRTFLNRFFPSTATEFMATPQAESTPNPNSLKFTTNDGAFLQGGVAAYSSAAEAEDHPLAERLFEISGIEDVFITPEFVTVSKTPQTEWPAVKPDVEKILREYLDAA